MEGAELANTLRNLLRSAKGGIPLKRLDDEFYTFAGVHIPLGAFRNLEELLKTLPDVCTLRSNDRGHLVVYGTKSRGQHTATVLGDNSKGGSSGSSSHRGGGHVGGPGGSSKRPPPGGRGGRGSHPQAPQNNGTHYAPRPRTGPSGRLPRRLPQSSNYQYNIPQQQYGQDPHPRRLQQAQPDFADGPPPPRSDSAGGVGDWDEWGYENRARSMTPPNLDGSIKGQFSDWVCDEANAGPLGGGVAVGRGYGPPGHGDPMRAALGGVSPPPQWSTHEDALDGIVPGAGPAGGGNYRLEAAVDGGGVGGGGGMVSGLETGLLRPFIDYDDSTGQQHQHHQIRRNRNNNNSNNNNSHNNSGSNGSPGGNQNNHGHGNNASTSNGHWRAGGGGRGPMSGGHHDNASGNQNQSSFGSRRGNMVWINPSIQYNGSGGPRSAREYWTDRPNAIPIVDPRSRGVVPYRHGGGHGAYGAPAGGAKGAGGAQGNSTTSLAMLEEFARASGLPAAEFQLMESKTNKKAAAAEFLCTVELDGIKYKSYPDYRQTAELAKEAAAAKALSTLGITKDNLQQRVAEKQASLPLAEMSTPAQVEAVASKLAQILEKRPNGVFSNSAPQLFAEEFKQKLPDDWQAKVADHKLLHFVPNTVAKCDVLYRREAEGGEQAQGSAAPQVPPLSITEEQFMFVTMLVVDVNNFYGRVEREEYHTLVSDMEAYYKIEANLAQQKLEPSDRPVVGALYAVYDESWHRVQCIADEAGSAGGVDVADFRYVDLGITESIPRQKLMHLAYDFYAVPFLAIQLRFEEFEESNVSDSKRPSVQALMERLMQNKILWAVPAPSVDLSARPLPVKVYDTGDDSAENAASADGGRDPLQSPQIDINTEIYKTVATPVIFPAPVIAKGYLSCVLPDGFIYLQIEDFGLSELRSLTVEPASETPIESVQENKVYCAQLEGSWYRCVATNIVSDQEIDIEFIDYGNRDTVDISKMFALKTGSHIEDLPPQAVRAHMTNLQPADTWTEEEIAKITDFCPEDQKLIIKLSSPCSCEGHTCDESVQHVDIFKRTQPNDELVSVNHKLSEELKATTSPASSTSNGHAGSSAKGERQAIGTHPPLVPVYSKAEPPTLGTTIMLHVVSAASPLSLIVQPFNTSSELANLRAQMQLYYGKQENRLEVSEFEVGAGEFFACLQDEIWERAYVEKASGAPSPDGATCTMVVCYFVDNGAYMPLPVAATSIQPLHQQFRQLPRQAIQARLHGVEPKEGAADFDPMDCITFQKHITGRDLEGKICGHSEDSRVTPAPTFSLALDLSEEDLPLRDLYAEMGLLSIVKEKAT